MRQENLHHKVHSDHRTQDYLLTIRIGKVSRRIVWNDDAPLLLDHPQGWTISKDGFHICISDGSEMDLERRTATMLLIPTTEKNRTTLEIGPPHNGSRTVVMSLKIEPLASLEPPYKQILYEGPKLARVPRQLLMYQGVRHFLLKYRPVGAKMIAYSGAHQIFAYSKVNNEYSITAFTPNLQIKSFGIKKPLQPGVAYKMSENEFFSATIIYGIKWWRFRTVISPDALPPLEDDQSEDDAREASRMRATSRVILSTLTILILACIVYNQFFPPEPKMIATKIELKTPKVIPHTEIAEVKPPPPPPPPPPPEPEKKKEVVKEKPKPAVEKKVAKQKEPKKPEKKIEKKVVKKDPVPVKEPSKPMPAEKIVKSKPQAAPPAQKALNTPPKPGVVAEKTTAPPAPNESAQLMKSLSFLSSGSKAPRLGGLSKYEKTNKKEFMNAPSLGGSAKDSATLNKLSAADTDTNIKSRSARSITSDAGFGSAKGKGLNEVQGKVSMTEIYNGGGGGFEEGTSLSLSGPGELSEAAIEKALSKFLSRFQFCYEKSLLTDSSLAGNIRLQWTITTSGNVADSKVLNSQMKSPPLQSCILGVLKEVPFPKPKGGPVTAKKTFSFKSSSL